MIEHWPWWLSGAALALVPLLHWLVLNRTLAVSGRYSALIDRLRFGADEEPELDTAALLAALRAETEREFGAQEITTAATPVEPSIELAPAERPFMHGLFLAGLLLGGLGSAWWAGAGVVPNLAGAAFARVVTELGVPAPLVLGFGGLLVGFGTRMAGGCTSGHGLCGVSQLQPGSLLATAAFFAAGVCTSLAFGAL